jgi:hypothetical protein
VVPLLVFHLWGAAFNVTTMEAMRFKWEHPRVPPPWCCGSPPHHWRLYAPHDRGVAANVRAFLAGTRSQMPAASSLEALTPVPSFPGDLEAGSAAGGSVGSSSPGSTTSASHALSHGHSHAHAHAHGHSHGSGTSVHRVLLGARGYSED